MYKVMWIVLLMMIISSCVTPPAQQPHLSQSEVQPKQSSLTPGMIKKHIVLNKTTQAEIMDIFGPPNMITNTGNGEMWGYDKVSREVAQAALGTASGSVSGIRGGGGVGVLGVTRGILGGVLGGISGGTTSGYGSTSTQSNRSESTTTVFLLLYFNNEEKVIDYKLSATKF